MNCYKLIIKGRMAGMNEVVEANRVNWAKGAKLKNDETLIVALTAKAQLRGVKIIKPVLVDISWFEQNSKRDIDNIASGVKFILDGLVQAGVLKNDSQKYVVGLVNKFYVDKDNPRVEVKLVEIRRKLGGL